MNFKAFEFGLTDAKLAKKKMYGVLIRAMKHSIADSFGIKLGYALIEANFVRLGSES